MKTIIMAIDCWENMPTEQIKKIGCLNSIANEHYSFLHEAQKHPAMPDWIQPTHKELFTYIYENKPTRLVYVGQHWNECIWFRPKIGIREMLKLRPWVEIYTVPSCCRIRKNLYASGICPDETLQATDLSYRWKKVSEDFYKYDESTFKEKFDGRGNCFVTEVLN